MIGRIAVAGTVACEAFAVYVLAEWLAAGYDPDDQHAVMAVTFVAIALIAYSLPRLADILALPARWRQVTLAAMSFFVLYGTIRLEFGHDFAVWNFGWVVDFMQDSNETARRGGQAILGSLLLFAVWVRAASRSTDEVDLELVPRHLAASFGLTTIVLILSVMTDRTGEVGRAGAAFYAVAVGTLATSQAARSGATIGDVRAGGVTAAMLGGVAVTAVVLMGLFALVIGIFGPWVGPPATVAAEHLFAWILTPPAWLLQHLFELLFRGGNPLSELPAPSSGLQAPSAGSEGPEQKSLASRAAIVFARMVVLLLVTAIVAAVVAFALRVRSRSRGRALNAGSASSAGSVGEDLGAIFRSLFHRGPARRSASGEGVIRLYSEVLLKASDKGRERPEGETAAEFAPELASTFHAPVTDDITAAFQEARYAGRDPDQRVLADLEQRWRQVT